jgi:hypothetical protein
MAWSERKDLSPVHGIRWFLGPLPKREQRARREKRRQVRPGKETSTVNNTDRDQSHHVDEYV